MNPSALPLRIRTFGILAVILAVVFFTYTPVLKGDFLLWDDDVHVLENLTIRGLDLEHVQDMLTSTVSKIYIPLTNLSFALEYHYFGYKPFVYHLDNLLLHLIVVIFVFLLGRKMGLSQGAAGAAALIFGIHPIHVESVAWITERKDVLYAVFYMAALLSYLCYLERRAYRFLALTTVLGALSMLAKPMALSLPLILLLLDWFHGRLSRRCFYEKAPLAALIAGLGWITYAAHARIPGESVAQSVLIWPWTFTFYLRQFVFPFISVPIDRLPKPMALSNPEYLLSLLVFLLIVVAVARFRRNRWFLFAVSFYFLSIFFLLRFDELKDVNVVADRFMYLPSAGFCLWLGSAIGRGFTGGVKGRLGRGVTAAMIFAVIGILSLKTFGQGRVWKDSISLWQHQLRYFPDEHLALNNLAIALRDQKDYKQAERNYKNILKISVQGPGIGLSEEAEESIKKVTQTMNLYKKAIAIDPECVGAQYNLANLYADIGMVTEAAEAYIRTLGLDPGYRDAHFNLGRLYQELGDYQQTIYAYEQTIATHPGQEDIYINVILAYNEALQKELDNVSYRQAREKTLDRLVGLVDSRRPGRATSFFNLGVVYDEMGEPLKAIEAYQKALRVQPNHAHALHNLGNVYKDLRRFDEALAAYQKAVQSNPRNAETYLNMGIIYGQRGGYSRAREYYQKAIAADPANPRAYFNLGYLNEATGALGESVQAYQKALTLNPENAEIDYNLGNVYIKLHRNEEALRAYLSAVAKNPGHVNAWINLSVTSFKMGDFKGAVKYCDEAVLLGYEAPEGYLKSLRPYRKR